MGGYGLCYIHILILIVSQQFVSPGVNGFVLADRVAFPNYLSVGIDGAVTDFGPCPVSGHD